MKWLAFSFVLLFLSLNAYPAQVVPVPRNLKPIIVAGGAKVTGTQADIGSPADALDADPSTLYRTPSINPAFVQIEFKQPQSVRMFRVILADRCEWKVETADTVADLKSQSGSFRDTTGQRVTDSDGNDVAQLRSPVTASVFRLSVRRVQGDDYVHIFDWQFAEPVPADKLRIEIIPQRPEWKPGPIISSEGVIKLRAVAEANGATLNVTASADWSSRMKRYRNRPGEYQAPPVATEREFEVTVRYDRLRVSQTVTVQPYAQPNRDFDLNVLFIERTPRLDFDAPDAGNGPGWPATGTAVKWIGHIKSWGRPSRNVRYQWTLNGQMVKEGRVAAIGADRVAIVEFPWKWQQARHYLKLQVAPVEGEQSVENNARTIATDALTVGFWVEKRLYDHSREWQLKQDPKAVGFEDWAQRQIDVWNSLMENAKYVSLPNGLSDRWRLDKITVVPSGSLPLNGGLPSNNPDNSDKTTDIVWGFNVDPGHTVSDYWKYRAHDPEKLNENPPPFLLDWALLHEMSHARYIIDSYGFDVHSPAIKLAGEDGKQVVGAYFKQGMVHGNKHRGLMGGGVNRYDEYVALALERVKGRRARGGNYNSPTVIGEYLEELPERNHFTLLDVEGKPLAGAELWIYQAKPAEGWYGKLYEDPPAFKLTTDVEGRVTLPRNPFGAKIAHTYGHANSTALWRIKHEAKVYFHFQEVSDFNLAYWKGNKQDAYYTITVELPKAP